MVNVSDTTWLHVSTLLEAIIRPTIKYVEGVTSKMYCHLDDLVLEGGEYSAQRSSCFTPAKYPVCIAQEVGGQ
jgi:hypothetical protein